MGRSEKDNINERFIEAIRAGNLELAKELLQYGADINARNAGGDTALALAVVYNMYVPTSNSEEEKNIKKELTPEDEKNYLEIIKLLIENGADVNSTDNDNCTPLMFAIATNNLPALDILFAQENIEVNIADNSGYTPLLYAAKFGWHHTISVLLEKGADINANDTQGNNALMIGIVKIENNTDNFFKTAKILIENNINVSLANKDGYTPLSFALAFENLDLAFMLLEKGAKFNTANKANITVSEMIEGLEKKYADPDSEKGENTDNKIEALKKIQEFIKNSPGFIETEFEGLKLTKNTPPEETSIYTPEAEATEEASIDAPEVEAIGEGINESDVL